jgi:lipid-binding SYLF domain-containing protein
MTAPALAITPQGQRLLDSKNVYQELLSAPDRGVPQELLEHAKCIVVIPHELKGAVGYGANFGHGVMSCRTATGWSAPTFVTLTGASAGFQIGAESTDLVMFFMSERGAHSLMTSSKVTLGGKMSVAAGPFGRSGEASTDLKLNAEIYSYAKSKGLFAGVSLEGARLAADTKSNQEYYGRPFSAKQLLFEHAVTSPPAECDAFTSALPK